MSPKRVHSVLRLPALDALQQALQQAEWRYNAEADEMNVLLPGWEGRPGRAILVEDALYVRLDVETGAVLSLLVPAYTFWQAEQLARPGVQEKLPLLTERLDADQNAERRALAAVVARALRECSDQTGAASTTA